MAVIAATNASVFERAERRPLTDVIRASGRYVPLLAIMGLAIGIHIATLSYYFFGDDFLVLGDIQTRTFPHYMRDVFLLDDLTPNWRPLTMAVYYGEFKLFGFDATAWRIVNLSVHIATIAVLYQLVLSISKRVFVASVAAMIFAVSASAVHTVTYITAFPHVLSEFLLISSLYAIHCYVDGGERRRGLYWLAFGLYVAGFLANEGGVVIGAVILIYYVAFAHTRHRDALETVVKMTPFALAAGLTIGLLAGSGKQGVDSGFYSVGWHIARETWVYMSRLAYPVGAIPLEPSAMEWIWGSIVAGFAIFFFIRGPHLARIAAVGMVIGIMPYAPGKIWTATRYTYMALPFFGILVALAAGWVHHHVAGVNKPFAHALAAAALIAVAGLYSWQTVHQTQPFMKETDRWEVLADELKTAYPDVPTGSTIYVIDDEGMWTNPYWQPTWMTSVGHALYGRDVTVRAIPSRDLEALQDTIEGEMLLARYDGGHIKAVSPETVSSQQD
ncbi:MAG TPA: hypothetical protein VFH62_07325 [Dehalococcoidia bacterium]|nr:hypothetical protein [Dehalococcoidia bacterium]